MNLTQRLKPRRVGFLGSITLASLLIFGCVSGPEFNVETELPDLGKTTIRLEARGESQFGDDTYTFTPSNPFVYTDNEGNEIKARKIIFESNTDWLYLNATTTVFDANGQEHEYNGNAPKALQNLYEDIVLLEFRKGLRKQKKLDYVGVPQHIRY